VIASLRAGSGAAAKLGIPPSTLESKTRAMNINKYRLKAFLPKRVPHLKSNQSFRELREFAKKISPR
jgi:hypothetical protein